MSSIDKQMLFAQRMVETNKHRSLGAMLRKLDVEFSNEQTFEASSVSLFDPDLVARELMKPNSDERKKELKQLRSENNRKPLALIESDLFQRIMIKYSAWKFGDDVTQFPTST